MRRRVDQRCKCVQEVCVCVLVAAVGDESACVQEVCVCVFWWLLWLL